MSLVKKVELTWACPGCQHRIRIEYMNDPSRTGAMSTVDCPVCGTSKMIPDTATRVQYFKDGEWIEKPPRSAYVTA